MDGSPSDYAAADALCNLAHTAQRKGDAVEAQRLFEAALAAFPKHYRSAFLLADLHTSANRLEAATEYTKLAYRIDPTPNGRQQVIANLVKLAFHHAETQSTAGLLADLDYLFSIAAEDEATALYGFIKEQYRSDPAIATAVARMLKRRQQSTLAHDWGPVPGRALLVLPPRPLSPEKFARFVKSIQQNLGDIEIEVAYRGDHATPKYASGHVTHRFDDSLLPNYSEVIFIDGPEEFDGRNEADLAAQSHDKVYRFDQRDAGFEMRLMPVGRSPNESDFPHISAHVFNRVTTELHNHYYFFPYGYLYRYLGFGPINPFGHRIAKDLAAYRRRPAHHKLIACFGGSSCFSMYCLHDEMFTSRLEARLNAWAEETANGLEFTVLNFGQHGNVVLNQLLTYQLFVYDLKPEVVIAHDGFNDLAYGQISDASLLAGHGIAYQTNLETWGAALNGNAHALPVEREVNGVRQVQSMPPAVLSAYLQRETQFARTVTNDGGKFIWGLQPFLLSKRQRSAQEKEFERKALHSSHAFLPCYRNMEHLYDMTVHSAATSPIGDFIDLHAAFAEQPATETHFFDFVHLSPVGDELIATRYANHLINHFQDQQP